MISAFTSVLHVSNLSKAEHLMNVLDVSGAFTKAEIQKIRQKTQGLK